GLAFLFVPINTVCYAFVPKEKTNQASGLINLARNIGGSIGISLMTTFLARRQQRHHNTIIEHLTPYDPTYRLTLERSTRAFIAHGIAPPRAARASLGALYAELERQAGMLAFADCFLLMAGFFAAAIALALLLKPSKARGPAMVH